MLISIRCKRFHREERDNETYAEGVEYLAGKDLHVEMQVPHAVLVKFWVGQELLLRVLEVHYRQPDYGHRSEERVEHIVEEQVIDHGSRENRVDAEVEDRCCLQNILVKDEKCGETVPPVRLSPVNEE